MKGNQVLFYITSSNEITPEYVELARQFNAYGIKLVPLNTEQFLQVKQEYGKANVLAIVQGLKDRKFFNHLHNKLLGFCLKNKLINLYHYSSFEPLPFYKVSFRTIPYLFRKLPVEVDELVEEVATDIWDQVDNFDDKPTSKEGFLDQFMLHK